MDPPPYPRDLPVPVHRALAFHASDSEATRRRIAWLNALSCARAGARLSSERAAHEHLERLLRGAERFAP